MQLKERMLEREMVTYLTKNNDLILDEEGCTDSTLVADYAEDLGYDTYLLEGYGELNETLLFIKKPEPYFVDND